jgi:hypothetical protein
VVQRRRNQHPSEPELRPVRQHPDGARRQDQPNQDDTVTIDTTSDGGAQVRLNGVVVSFGSDVSTIDLQLGGGSNTVKVLKSPGNVDIASHGYDSVTVGDGSLAELGGSVTIGNAAGTTFLIVDDSANPTPRPSR